MLGAVIQLTPLGTCVYRVSVILCHDNIRRESKGFRFLRNAHYTMNFTTTLNCGATKHTVQDIIADLRENCEDVPDDVATRVNTFIDDLVERGYAGYETQKV